MNCKYCNGEFFLAKNVINGRKKKNNIGPVYCSVKCKNDGWYKKITDKCGECGTEITKQRKEFKKSKSGYVFCNNSCAAKYNNTHKTTGTRRSKMEVWIEESLRTKYDFEILFNNKEIIGSELDIYIPHLKLAFELNGIFHYEPIFGDKKLEQTINNDNRKFQACLENGIEFCIIDTSGSKKFKPERDKKYLDIIENILKIKMAL